MLDSSLRRLGVGRSVLIDKNNRIIAGNKTVEAARGAGISKLQIIDVDGDTIVAVRRNDLDLTKDKNAKELAIADNRVAEVDLQWNGEVLAGFEDIDLGQFWNETELRGVLGEFAPPDPEAPAAKIDQAEELRKKWNAAAGQIWSVGRHRLMCGSSIEQSDVRALLDGATPGLCVTDPPYGVNYDPDWRNDAAQAGASPMGAPGGRSIGIVLNDDIVDWSKAWNLCPSSVIYCWHAGVHSSRVQESLEQSGFVIRNQIIWAKNHLAISRGHYHWQHEPCWYAVRQGKTSNWIGDRSQTTLWEISREEFLDAGHGTQKPLECMTRPIRNHDGDVYEPFAGTGTTVCAAELLDRKCYAMELSPAYAAVCLERFSEMGLKPKLLK